MDEWKEEERRSSFHRRRSSAPDLAKFALFTKSWEPFNVSHSPVDDFNPNDGDRISVSLSNTNLTFKTYSQTSLGAGDSPRSIHSGRRKSSTPNVILFSQAYRDQSPATRSGRADSFRDSEDDFPLGSPSSDRAFPLSSASLQGPGSRNRIISNPRKPFNSHPGFEIKRPTRDSMGSSISNTVESVVESVLGRDKLSTIASSTRLSVSKKSPSHLSSSFEHLMVPKKLWWSNFSDFEIYSQNLSSLPENICEYLRDRIASEGCPLCGKYSLENDQEKFLDFLRKKDFQVIVLKSRIFDEFHVAHASCLNKGTGFKTLLSYPPSNRFKGKVHLQESDGFVYRSARKVHKPQAVVYEMDIKVYHVISNKLFAHFSQEGITSQLGELNNDVVQLKAPTAEGILDFPVSKGRIVFSCMSSVNPVGFQFQGVFDVAELLDVSIPDFYREFGMNLNSSMDLILTDSMTGNLLVLTISVGLHKFIISSIQFETGSVVPLSTAVQISSSLKSMQTSFSQKTSRDLSSDDSAVIETIPESKEPVSSYSLPSEMVEEKDDVDLEAIIEGDLPFEGYVVALAKSQNGSRFLQDKIDGSDSEDLQLIIEEALPQFPSLIVDLFGNYLCQKLMQTCTLTIKLRILDRLSEDMFDIACDRQGTRVMQKIIEFSESKEETDIIIQLITPRAVELMFHPHGSYVINAMIEFIEHSRISQILDVAFQNVDTLALNQHGLCVLKKMISTKTKPIVDTLAPKILRKVPEFVNNQYGNYIIQHLLSVANDDIKKKFHEKLKGQYSKLACQKFASNVVEKCLSSSPKICEEIIDEFITDPNIGTILQDSYGNYVMQSALTRASVRKVDPLKNAIRPALVNLRKKIQKKWERLLDCRSPKTSNKGTTRI